MNVRPFLFLIPFLLIFAIPFWVDPDAIGTFNHLCSGGDGNVPILSATILSSLPCSILVWKTFHLLLLLAILWVFSKEYSLSIFGLVGFATGFLLTLEDDLIAFLPILVYGIWVLAYSKQYQADCLLGVVQKSTRSQQKLLFFVGVLLTLFLGLFVWTGAFLIMGILLAYLVKPQLAIIPPIIYILLGEFNNWGNSSEAIIGNAFILGQIGLFIWLYFLWKNRSTFSFRSEYYLLIALEVLTFFQPKWGEWLIIPLAFLLEPYFDKDERLRFFGIWMMILTIVTLIFTSFPSSGEIRVIETAVIYQKMDYNVLNDWGVGHYFSYYGGVPSQEGGFKGKQNTKDAYWLGPDANCETLISANSLFFQKC